MQHNSRDIIIQVLLIIGYEDDKDIYATEFLQNCEKQALLDLVSALPKEQQEGFQQQIAEATDQEQQKAIIKAYITPEQYQEALQKAAATAFEEFLDEVMPTLTAEQNSNLQTYLQSLAPLNNTRHA